MENMVAALDTEKHADDLLSAANATAQSANQTNNYGIEVEEVEFSAFDRRKAPRLNSQKAFTEFVESQKSDDLIQIIT